VRLRERDKGGVRCPFCREDVGGEVAPCAGCGVRLHPACAGELGRCPTLGCGQTPVALDRFAGQRPAEARLRPGPGRFVWPSLALVAVLLVYAARALSRSHLGELAFATIYLTIASAFAGYLALRRARVARFPGARLLVQPPALRPGQPLLLTLVLPPRLRALARSATLDGEVSMRVELRRVRRHAAPGRGAQAPGHVAWRTVALADARQLRGEQVTFEFVPPNMAPGREHVWELAATCELPGPDFEASWELPVAE